MSFKIEPLQPAQQQAESREKPKAQDHGMLLYGLAASGLILTIGLILAVAGGQADHDAAGKENIFAAGMTLTMVFGLCSLYGLYSLYKKAKGDDKFFERIKAEMNKRNMLMAAACTLAFLTIIGLTLAPTSATLGQEMARNVGIGLAVACGVGTIASLYYTKKWLEEQDGERLSTRNANIVDDTHPV